jgi:hypothetical protein
MTDFAAMARSDRALTPEECAALAARAAAEVDPSTHVREGDHQRIYERLWYDEHSEGWLVSWWDERDTGYHDHDGSNGGIAVLEGRVTEEPLVVRGAARVKEYGPGDTLCFGGAHIHRMHHDPEAVTIHVYSPPIRRIGAYEIVDGVLTRTPGSPDEESPQSPALDDALTG